MTYYPVASSLFFSLTIH